MAKGQGRKKELERCGGAERVILAALEEGPLSSEQLQERTGVKKATAYLHLKRLFRAGVIDTEDDYEGRRKYRLCNQIDRQSGNGRLYENSIYYSILKLFLNQDILTARDSRPSAKILFESPCLEESQILRRIRDDPKIIGLVLQELIKDGLLTAYGRNQRKRVTYTLSKQGLLWALRSSRIESFDKIKWQNIAHSYLPLFPRFFSKWNLFVQNKADGIAVETLKVAVESPLIWDPRQNLGTPLIASDRLESEFVFPTPSYDKDALFHTIASVTRGDAWLRAVTTDAELSELAAKIAWERYDRYDKLARMWKHVSGLLTKLQSDPTAEVTVSDLWSYGLEFDDPTATLADLLLKMQDKLQPAKFKILSYWLGMSIRAAP